MESLRQEESLGGLSSCLLTKARYDANSDQVLRALIHLCLGNFQRAVIFIVILFFFLIAWASPLFNLRPLALVFPLRTTVKCLGPSPCWPPCRFWGLLLGAWAAASSPGWTSPAPSPSPHHTRAPSGIKLLMKIPVLSRNHSIFALSVCCF